MQRRDFFRLMMGLPFAIANPIAEAASQQRTLVLIELAGGNDALSTLVPLKDPLYYKLRPNIAIPKDQSFAISEQLGMHKSLAALMPWWKKGQMAWIQGLGYDNPIRSHFSSLDVWERGALLSDAQSQGWLASTLPKLKSNYDVQGICLSNDLGPLSGLSGSVLLTDIDQFMTQSAKISMPSDQIDVKNPALDHIRAVSHQAKQASDHLLQRFAKHHVTLPPFPSGTFGKRLATAAELILSGVNTPVIKLTLSSFDTHNNQRQQHDTLLSLLANGLNTFATTLQQAGKWNDVLVMTYSEFGRRVAENGSQGTDHGAAAAHFLLGGKVKSGIYGALPNLADLDDGDLKYSVDFRQLYATITRHWWGIHSDYLQARGFHALPLLNT